MNDNFQLQIRYLKTRGCWKILCKKCRPYGGGMFIFMAAPPSSPLMGSFSRRHRVVVTCLLTVLSHPPLWDVGSLLQVRLNCVILWLCLEMYCCGYV